MTLNAEVSRATTLHARPLSFARARARALALLASVAAVASLPACAAPADGVATDEAVDEAQSAVVGGTTDADYKYPWAVTVSSALTCRGVLLTPFTVLTAAHCIAHSGGTVSYERTDPYTGVRETASRSIATAGVHIHPDYDPTKNYHDIALVSVVGAFDLGPHLQTIALGVALILTSCAPPTVGCR